MDTWMWALKKQMLAQQRPIEDNRGLVAPNKVNIYRVVFMTFGRFGGRGRDGTPQADTSAGLLPLFIGLPSVPILDRAKLLPCHVSPHK